MSTIWKYHLTWTFFFQIIPLQHCFPKLVIQIQQNIGKRIRLKQRLRSWIHIRCGRQWAGTVRLNPKLRYKYTNSNPTKTSGLELNATATIITLIIIFLISISFFFSCTCNPSRKPRLLTAAWRRFQETSFSRKDSLERRPPTWNSFNV